MNKDNNILNLSKQIDQDDLMIFSTKKRNSLTSEEILDNTLLEYNINPNYLASCMQIHSDVVTFIDKPGIYRNTDGLVTYFDSGIILKIQTADCLPVFMVDKYKKIIGLVHSGWKGTQKRIILSALKIFLKHGSKASDVKIYIGPSIKDCCYEIKEDVAKLFDNSFVVNKNNKLFLDLVSKIKYDLFNNGVETIYESDICTYHNEEFCSYRREKGSVSRMYSVIGKIN